MTAVIDATRPGWEALVVAANADGHGAAFQVERPITDVVDPERAQVAS